MPRPRFGLPPPPLPPLCAPCSCLASTHPRSSPRSMPLRRQQQEAVSGGGKRRKTGVARAARGSPATCCTFLPLGSRACVMPCSAHLVQLAAALPRPCWALLPLSRRLRRPAPAPMRCCRRFASHALLPQGERDLDHPLVQQLRAAAAVGNAAVMLQLFEVELAPLKAALAQVRGALPAAATLPRWLSGPACLRHPHLDAMLATRPAPPAWLRTAGPAPRAARRAATLCLEAVFCSTLHLHIACQPIRRPA